jgi:hypothetical protein
VTLAETCDELEDALEHERSEVRDWWTMSRLLRALVELGELQRDQVRHFTSDDDRFATLKARAQEVIGHGWC